MTQKEEDRNRKSGIIARKLLRSGLFRRAKNVMVYIALGGEVDTKDMIRILRRNAKTIVVPVCRASGRMAACRLPERGALVHGVYGTREPAVKSVVQVRDIDVVLVPGLAFDRRGNRLGRGKGCYDRFLKRLPPRTRTIGLAFDFQIMPSLPVTAHDTAVDRVCAA